MRVFKKSKTSRRFTIELADHLGIVRRFSGLTDRRQTEQLGKRIEGLVGFRVSGQQPDREASLWLERTPINLRVRLAELGIIDRERIGASKPLTEMVELYRDALEAKARTRRHVARTVAMISKAFAACKFTNWSDIHAGRLEMHLKAVRDGGLSSRSSNAMLVACKSFCLWVVSTGLASESPLRTLRTVNQAADRCHERRAATADELRKLIAATAQGPERYGMTGQERALLYQFMAQTGLRVNEVRCLSVSDIDLDRLEIVVRAAYSKHRETDVIPIREDLADALRSQIQGRLPSTPVFGGCYRRGRRAGFRRLTDKTHVMMRQDLEAAGLPYKDDAGRYLDNHSLRHSYITALSHAPSRVAQALARHKSSAMTDHYTHVHLHDERAALELLPDLRPIPQSVQATGTDGRTIASESGARPGALSRTEPRISAQFGAEEDRGPVVENAVIERSRMVHNFTVVDTRSAGRGRARSGRSGRRR